VIWCEAKHVELKDISLQAVLGGCWRTAVDEQLGDARLLFYPELADRKAIITHYK